MLDNADLTKIQKIVKTTVREEVSNQIVPINDKLSSVSSQVALAKKSLTSQLSSVKKSLKRIEKKLDYSVAACKTS